VWLLDDSSFMSLPEQYITQMIPYIYSWDFCLRSCKVVASGFIVGIVECYCTLVVRMSIGILPYVAYTTL
jgi:ABC-type transporter Mla maintaining outer membrane lipid asymmetry permease subunit MlaE